MRKIRSISALTAVAAASAVAVAGPANAGPSSFQQPFRCRPFRPIGNVTSPIAVGILNAVYG